MAYQANYTIYSNESVAEGPRNGGAIASITRGPPTQPEVLTTIKTQSRAFTSFYEEEAAAMESAVTSTSTTANHPSFTILICAHGKSLCEVLLSSNPSILFIHESVTSISSYIYIQLISGHSDIPGNEIANKATKEARTIVTNTILPVSYSSSLEVISNEIHDNPPTYDTFTMIYQHQKASRDSKQTENQWDNVLFARLQSGHNFSVH